MQTKVELQCIMQLLFEGVPQDLVQQWYEAIYVDPDFVQVRDELMDYVSKMTDGDIMDLLVEFGENGSMAALVKMKDYFVRLYEIEDDLPVRETDEVRDLACVYRLKGRELVNFYIGVDLSMLSQADGAELLAEMAHEMWHAKQISSMYRWLQKLGGTRIDFDRNPKVAEREMLYYLNYRQYIASEVSYDDYGKQIVEQEAYFASSVMFDRIRRFSKKVFERAMCAVRTRAAQQRKG